MPDSLLNWGVDLILQMQAILQSITSLMNGLSFLGSENFFLLFFPFLIWCVDTTIGIRLYVYLGISWIVNLFFKVLIHDPRPYWYDGRVQLLAPPEYTFGIPSGHAQNAVLIWGFIASVIKKTWAWIAALLLILLVGISRFHLGVHFPTDVFVGWALGLVVLLVSIGADQAVVAWFRKFSYQGQILVLFILSIALILLAALTVRTVEANFAIPASWVENVNRADPEGLIDPYTLTAFVTTIASTFGGIAGVIWLSERRRFDAGGPWIKRITRYLLGMIVAVAIWMGLDIAFAALAADETVLGLILRFVRYSAVGIWVGGLAPMAFLRLGLAAEKGS